MFTVVTDRPRRRSWTPRTVAASLFAHLVLVIAVATGSTADAPGTGTCWDCGSEWPPVPCAIGSVTPPPPPPVRGWDDVMRGDAVLRPPDEISITDLGPTDASPASEPTEGEGRGTGADVPAAASGSTSAAAEPELVTCENDFCTREEVTVLPRLLDEIEARRILQRVYPPLLRDAGVTGTTVVTLIIDREGNVVPGSVSIQDSTHPGFEDAARRAVERFHFAPAQLNGRGVSVSIALPIEWRLQN